jgi:FKBP-type peptidyl-prolyl cis-trans isomerase
MKLFTWLLFFVIASSFLTAQDKEITKDSLKTEMQKVSYSLGYNMGQSLLMQKIYVNPEIFVKGIKDATANNPLISEEELDKILMDFHSKTVAAQEKTKNAEKEINIKEGNDFLAANKVKDGVIVLPSGLQYKEVKKGFGEKPADADKVTVHYRGYFIDGDEFDNSYKRKQTATFPVIGVIPGWTEALKLMSVGSKWELYIPYQLAYGENGRPPKIGPAKTLLFEVELLNISKGE